MSLSANLQLDLMATGSNVGGWGTILNTNEATLDACVGSITTKSLTNANVSLTNIETRVSILRFTGTLTGNCTITIGNATIKSWICENLTTGAFVVKMAGASGNVVALPPGSSQVYWDGTNMSFINLGRVGEYWDDCGTDTPLWVSNCTVPPALKCDGSSFSSVTYPILNFRLGGTTLPDFRGRSAAYLNGGTGRITTAGSGIDGNTRFSAGGAENITLDTTMIPAHAHGVTDPTHTHLVGFNQTGTGPGSVETVKPFTGAAGSYATSASSTGISINNTGGSSAHNNMPPAVISGVRMIWAG